MAASCYQYLTTGQFVGEHSNFGGMSTKTLRVLEVFKQIADLELILSPDDISPEKTLIIEPLAIRSLGSGDVDHGIGIEGISEILSSDVEFILYTSELEILRLPYDIRNFLIRRAKVVTHACPLMFHLLKSMDVRSRLLTDPIPDLESHRAEPNNVILSTGSINHPQGDLFYHQAIPYLRKHLPDYSFEFAGSFRRWGGEPRPDDIISDNRFVSLFCKWHGWLPSPLLASRMGSSKLWFSLTSHDVFCSTLAEAQSMRLPTAGLNHPACHDRLSIVGTDILELCDMVIEFVQEETDLSTVLEEKRQHFESYLSYDAFTRQFAAIEEEFYD